ncbi:MAG: site-2 protease family protein [Atopobiaceae bacterium]|jgi:regulator of sigma E protease|nr:site-2 protease family protein [Atopobiaceae bacterium]
MTVLSAIFWGVVVLSLLVMLHEGGHFLIARVCGMRVTEYYLGMPCKLHVAYKSKKYGTEFGITPILLGGYTRICGMETLGDENLAQVLACVQRSGTTNASRIAAELSLDVDDVIDDLLALSDCASIRALGDGGKGKEALETYETCRRDVHMLTEYDRGHNFAAQGTTEAGVARPVDDPADFLRSEQSHTYTGKGFWRRFFTLVAGAAVNIVLAFLIVVAVVMSVGYETIVDSNVLGGVQQGSLAEEAGIQAGDALVQVDGVACSNWTDITAAVEQALDKAQPFEVAYQRDGQTYDTTIELPEDGSATAIGVLASTMTSYPDLLEASQMAVSYGWLVAKAAVELIMPQHTIEILNQSTSVVGISVMASEAASSGIENLLLFVAAISMSLGFMNLLPIPPLDGGKILIEVVQAITRRPLSPKAQIAISYVGLAFFVFIFLYALQHDIVNFVLD